MQDSANRPRLPPPLFLHAHHSWPSCHFIWHYIIAAVKTSMLNMTCGYKVPGTILMQTYQYTYCLLRRFMFEVLPLSSYSLGPTMLPL
jgi:hypothetical protein